MEKTIVENYDNLRIISTQNEKYITISAFVDSEIILRREDGYLHIRVSDKYNVGEFYTILKVIYSYDFEWIPERILANIKALQNLCSNIVNENIDKFCGENELEYYGNSYGRWVRMIA